MQEGKVELDGKTALIVVDVQNDFADPEGKLFVSDGDSVIPLINELIERARGNNAFVVYTQDWHPESTPHFEKDGGRWPAHCVRGTWGAELHPELNVVGPTVKKGTGGEDGYSAFSNRDVKTGEESPTPLGAMLRDRSIERVVVVGLAQDVCVLETAVDADRRGFETVIMADATRPVNAAPGDGDRAIARACQAGVEVR